MTTPLPNGYQAGAPLSFGRFAGLRNRAQGERLAIDDLTEARNVDLSNDGQLSRRAGQSPLFIGSSHSLYADASIACAVIGGTLYQITADLLTYPLLDGLADNAPLNYLRFDDRLYWGNGEQMGVIENGLVRSWGLPVPPLPLASAIDGGSFSAGVVQYVLVWLRADGQASGATLAGRLTVAEGQGIAFALPLPTDPDIVTADLYLSPPNGKALYHAASLPAATRDYRVFNNGLSFSYPLATQFLQPAPVGHLLTEYKGRIYIATDGALQASQPFAPELFDARDFLIPDGSRIVLLEAVTGGLWIGTENGLYFATGDAPADLALSLKMTARAIPGAVARIDGAQVGDGSLNGETLLITTCRHGILQAGAGGELRALSSDRFVFEASGHGATLVRDLHGALQYLSITSG
jgi:hypothetical protein